MAVVAMPLAAVTVLHAGTFAVTALVAMTWLPWLLIGLPAGAWVDRLPRRAVMVACDLIAVALYASVPLAASAGVLTIGQLLAVGLLGGAAGVLFTTAYQAYLPSLLPREQLVEGNAKMQGSAAAARLGGPGLAGLVAQALGVITALLFNAASFLVSCVCLIAIRTPVPRPPRAPCRQTIRADIAEGVRFVSRDPYLRPMGLFGAVVNFALSGNQALAVVFLVRVIGAGPLAAGLLLAVPGVSGLLAAVTTRRLTRRVGTARGLLLCVLATSPFGLLIPLAQPGRGLVSYVAGTLIVASRNRHGLHHHRQLRPGVFTAAPARAGRRDDVDPRGRNQPAGGTHQRCAGHSDRRSRNAVDHVRHRCRVGPGPAHARHPAEPGPACPGGLRQR